jgi:Fic family protein
MDNWEKYYHLERPDPLVQLAILHAQFEIIHPFNDGNGRLGRMIIPLFLYDRHLLSQPMFYLSAYLEQHRDGYIDSLRALSEPGRWNQWIAFFLQAVTTQAESNAQTARSIWSLYDRLKDQIARVTKSRYAVPLLDCMFETPVFRSTSLEKRPGMPSRQTIHSLLERLKEEGVLQVAVPGSGRRPELLILGELVELSRGGSNV